MASRFTRRLVNMGFVAAPVLALSTPSSAARTSQPNILFILADDLGYADLSCFGRRDFQTPQLDRLAASGMRFTHAYANSPVCSPTRVALITGNYQYRLPVGLAEPLGPGDLGLDPSVPTLPSLLREAGYHTALVGKWHMGALPRYGPLQSGYDHFWGFRGGGVDYFTHASVEGAHDLWDGDAGVQATGYMTDLLADRAIDQLTAFAAARRPFLLSLHFSAPHWPWEGPNDEAVSERLARAGGGLRAMLHYDGGDMATYAAMVTRMDQQIGRVLQALRRLRLERDTIVVFTSDNGGERFSDTWPFSGRKTELLEGGIRVPTIIRWPGRVRPGATNDTPIMSMDFLPTFLSAAGVRRDGFDGADITPALMGQALPERTLFWRYRGRDQQACRRGAWKYLKIAENSYLFDVIADPLERANRKLNHPEIFEALQSAYDEWNETMLPLDPNTRSHVFTGAELADRFPDIVRPRPTP